MNHFRTYILKTLTELFNSKHNFHMKLLMEIVGILSTLPAPRRLLKDTSFLKILKFIMKLLKLFSHLGVLQLPSKRTYMAVLSTAHICRVFSLLSSRSFTGELPGSTLLLMKYYYVFLLS